ncbi:MAG TPA: hypothetical protein VFW29_12365 [Solirubrobacteraceae bacterium]|nr:hypothetical protein [Solirubrobacteraceae bacterium]
MPVVKSPARVLFVAIVAALAGAVALAADASAALLAVGSPLSVPATLNTAEDLAYPGTYTAVPPTPEYPTGRVHTFHFGSDAAIFNTTLASGQAAMPATGQAVKVALEGCAKASPGGPPPLTQIHFQTVHPLGNGTYKVELSSQAFDIPVCATAGQPSGTTVTTYEPTNLCVSQGDYVAFNDEGGFVENVYRSGVPYQVMGSVPGSSFDSFLKNEGTGNGSVLDPGVSSSMDGFALNAGKELMMQVTLGTGTDARYVCGGGTKDAPKVLAPLSVHPQTDGVNHSRIVSVAIYCRPAGGCAGNAALTAGTRQVGRKSFTLPGNKTSHLAIRIASSAMRTIRKHHGLSAMLTATMGSTTVSQPISVKIF